MLHTSLSPTRQAIRQSVNRRMLLALNSKRDMSVDNLGHLNRIRGGSEAEIRRKAGDEGRVPNVMELVGRKMSSTTRKVSFVGGQVQFSDVEADK
jgi:hypothetical protein